ncbi:uncharacterized protein PSANT_06706 [Moesziomyces antarcticus]|uniref:DNA replication checkpoint mediator MRC1 domain-containing protein n=1 Tax=Pseudozyma antarctica TaxID=84753 RepID=A0A5C3FYT4_PSEA2|nr:uncharacterized protein PSANT_06706 [Moesziomyces antarcticus]
MQSLSSSASTLSSLDPSSSSSSAVPSIEAASHPGARANVTYSRKPLADAQTDLVQSNLDSATSSSQPASPSPMLFDSPMRHYTTAAPSHQASGSPRDNAVCVPNTAVVSPATTAHADSSAVKHATSSLHRQHHSQDSLRTTFQIGRAKAIYDSDSGDDDDELLNAHPTNLPSHDAQDDDAIIARIRAQAAPDVSSDPFTGSLSSLPLSSLPPSSSRASDQLDPATDDTYDPLPLPRRHGAKVSAMRGKQGAPNRATFSSSSDQDDDDEDALRPRTFNLASSAALESAPPHHPQPSPPLSRRQRIEALAAKARHALGDVDVDPHAQPDALVPAFVAHSKHSSDQASRSRSPSLDIQDSDADIAPRSSASAKFAEPSLLAHDAAPTAPSHVPPKIKPLSHKELDSMHKQTARLARENRVRIDASQPKKTIGLGQLFSKITGKETPHSDDSHATSTSTPTEPPRPHPPPASSGHASSQIPSGQSKSLHNSDPIESDPIRERSSPHSNHASSPLVPLSRKHDHRRHIDPSLHTPSVSSGLAPRSELASSSQPPTAITDVQDDDDDDDAADLPDLASLIETARIHKQTKELTARYQQGVQQIKLRLLENARQPSSSQPTSQHFDVAHGSVPSHTSDDGDDDQNLVVYRPGSVLAQKHNLPTTPPGKKRHADRMYRELGIFSGKKPESSSSYRGTNDNGSPNAASTPPHLLQDDDDECMPTDIQLRNASKALFPASDQATPNLPTTQLHVAAAQLHQSDSAMPASQPHGGPRVAPSKLSQLDLNSTLMRQMQTQTLKVRIQRDPNDAAAKLKLAALADASQRSTVPDIQAMLHHLHRPSDPKSRHGREAQYADHDEDDPDCIMPSARDVESVVGSVIGSDIGSDMGSDVDMGSASEVEADDFDDDFVPLGGVLEDQDDDPYAQHADAGKDDLDVPPHDPLDDSEEEHDSDKENAPLPASQQSHRSQASPDPAYSLLPSRAVMDEDEDELPGPRINARRGRRSALADDDAEGQADQNSLQPGPFEAIHGEDVAAEATLSSEQARIPLADISSQVIDLSMALSRSNTTSPVVQHAQLPTTTEAEERDSLIFPPTAGDNMDESFRTDDIPSQAADLGRFFESTMPSSTAIKYNPLALQAPRKSFWDETQTQTQSQNQGASHSPAAAGRPHANEVARELTREPSANSALGAFFNATQDEELRGESLDIFANAKTARAKAHGLTALSNDGGPSPFGHTQASAEPWKLGTSARDASSMPPPKSTEIDAFAALRKAQMGAAMELLDPTLSALPSFDESQAERDAYAQGQRSRHGAHVSPEKMYMNRDGFFTQTTPSQQPGFWSQYDTQSQSQSQDRAPSKGNRAVNGAAWQRAAPGASARRGSDGSIIGPKLGKTDVLEDQEEQDVPVQLKRLRRGGVHVTEAAREDEGVIDRADARDDADKRGSSSGQPETRPRDAFNVLLGRSLPTEEDDTAIKGRKRKSAFIEGEAEESEDEDLGEQKRGDGGGLKGVFADDNGSDSGKDEDEDDEDDDDVEDLQELVDNERDVDEAQKDEVARARFREDMKARDREDLEIHQKAIQGGYRNRRGRGAGLNGIEGFLDDDADEEELQRRAALGLHMSSSAWKKRKLLDGTQDGMDALAAHDEAQAFVHSYVATHKIEHQSDKYDFLLPQSGDADAEAQESDEDDDQGEARGGRVDEDEDADEDEGEDEQKTELENVDEDAFGPVVTKQPRKIRYDDVRAAVRERRKAKSRTALDDDDDDDDEEQRKHRDGRSGSNGSDSEEDDAGERLASALRSRVRGDGNGSGSAGVEGVADAVAPAPRKPHLGMQYRRAKARATGAAPAQEEAEFMDVDVQPVASAGVGEGDEEASGSLSLMARLLKRPAASARRAALASQTLSMSLDTLEEAEPEWGNEANLVRAPKATAGGASQGSSSATSGGKSALPLGSSVKVARTGSTGAAPMLSSKQEIMRRGGGFVGSSASQ